MSSLSTGTLNLKFMQRAAAKSGTTAPVIQRGTIPAEEDAKWWIPSNSRKVLHVSKREEQRGIESEIGKAKGKGRVVFESSYVPFLGFGGGFDDDREEEEEHGDGGVVKDEEDDEDMSDIREEEGSSMRVRSSGGPSSSSSVSAGGGRIRFGSFGQKEEVKEDEDEDDGGDGDEQEEDDDEEENPRIRNKTASNKRGQPSLSLSVKSEPRSTPRSAQNKPHITEKGFARPSNYSPAPPKPSSITKTTNPKPPRKDDSKVVGGGVKSRSFQPEKVSAADRLRQTISQSRVPQTTVSSSSSSSQTTSKVEPPSHISQRERKSNMHSPNVDVIKSKSTDRSKGKKRAVDPSSPIDTKRVKIESLSSQVDSKTLLKISGSSNNTPGSETQTQDSQPLSSSAANGPVDLDARARELKAQKRKEKKAKKKAGGKDEE